MSSGALATTGSFSTLTVSGGSTLHATTVTTLTASGAVTLDSTLTVKGNVTIGTSKVLITAATGATTIKGNLTIGANKLVVNATNGNTAVGGTLNVTGASTLHALTATTETASGLATLNGGIKVGANKFTVAANGNTTIAGTVLANGATAIVGNLTVGTPVTGGGAAAAKFFVSAAKGHLSAVGGLFSVGANGNVRTQGTLSAMRSQFTVGNNGSVNSAGWVNVANGINAGPAVGTKGLHAFSVEGSGSVSAASGKFVVGALGGIYAAAGKFNVSSKGVTSISAPRGSVALTVKSGGNGGGATDIADFVGHTGKKVTISQGGDLSVGGNLTITGGITFGSASPNITSTGSLSAADFTVTNSITLPSNSVADSALSTNVALYSAASPSFTNTLSADGLDSSGGLDISGGTVTLPSNSVANSALQNDVVLNDASSNELTGDLTVDGGFTADGTVTLPAASIADSALQSDVAISGAGYSPTFDDVQATTAEISDTLETGDLTVDGQITWLSNAPSAYSPASGAVLMTANDLVNNRLVIVNANEASQSNTHSLQFPTAASIVGALDNPVVGSTFAFTIDNYDVGTAQVVTSNTGVTFGAGFPGYVTYHSQYTFNCRVTDATGGSEAVTCY